MSYAHEDRTLSEHEKENGHSTVDVKEEKTYFGFRI